MPAAICMWYSVTLSEVRPPAPAAFGLQLPGFRATFLRASYACQDVSVHVLGATRGCGVDVSKVAVLGLNYLLLTLFASVYEVEIARDDLKVRHSCVREKVI